MLQYHVSLTDYIHLRSIICTRLPCYKSPKEQGKRSLFQIGRENIKESPVCDKDGLAVVVTPINSESLREQVPVLFAFAVIE